MIVLIHDLASEKVEDYILSPGNEVTAIADDGEIRHCLGCFGCWVKTPGVCVIKDDYSNMGELLGACKEVRIISQCVYGGFSPFVKNVLDRSIPYIHPDFRFRQGATHHRLRYKNSPRLTVNFYGDALTETERQTAGKLVKANAINMGWTIESVRFFESIEKLVNGGCDHEDSLN